MMLLQCVSALCALWLVDKLTNIGNSHLFLAFCSYFLTLVTLLCFCWTHLPLCCYTDGARWYHVRSYDVITPPAPNRSCCTCVTERERKRARESISVQPSGLTGVIERAAANTFNSVCKDLCSSAGTNTTWKTKSTELFCVCVLGVGGWSGHEKPVSARCKWIHLAVTPARLEDELAWGGAV